MVWYKYRIETTTEAEDIVSSALFDIGFEGVEIEDKVPLTAWEKERMFVDILPDGPEDDGIAYLSFYQEVDDNVSESKEDIQRKTCDKIRACLEECGEYCNVGSCEIVIDETEDIDWINNWKQYFHQFYVDDLVVVPSWEEVKPEDKDKMVLHIDPGTAFGTGMHDTTQLCIRQLKKYITKDTELLDVGTGSGILAILSIMFGAKNAIGTDLDPCAIEAVKDNMKNNNIPEDRFRLIIGNIIDNKEIQDEVGYEKYDIVVANILAGVLELLTPVIINQMKPGAIYITSGIINEKEETVVNACKKAGLEVIEVHHQGEWCSVTARKN